jgi:phosphoserine aminotransferase
MLPMNFIPEGGKAEYILTGHWAKTALKEAKRYGGVASVSTEKDGAFRSIPKQSEIKVDPAAAYVHMTSNNTIFGTQWQYWPEVGSVPLIADMSSDIFSRPFPADKFSLVYAGAQKNLGPSGVLVAAVKESFLAKAKEDLPSMLSYKVQAANNSLFNTPPCFSVYVLDLTLDWIKSKGGLKGLEKINDEKARILYEAIDSSGGFYNDPVDKADRSRMNVVFRLGSEELEEKFVKEAKAAGIIGVKGHRSVGGIRFSIYNANLVESVQKSVDFMKDFQKRNG